jgi:hypothetical protein
MHLIPGVNIYFDLHLVHSAWSLGLNFLLLSKVLDTILGDIDNIVLLSVHSTYDLLLIDDGLYMALS